MPTGSIYLVYMKGHGLEWKPYEIPLDGIIRAELMVNPDEEIRIIPKKMSGYAVSDSFLASTPNLEIDCLLLPAGSVILRCEDKNGMSVANYDVSVWEKENNVFSDKMYLGISRIQTDMGTCVVEPIAIGREYQIHVSKYRRKDEGGWLHFQSDWFSLSKSSPVKKLKCVLKPVE